MSKQWTDLDTWMCDNADERLFRVWKYKKVFTPYEMDKKFVDESPYEDDVCMYAWLDEVVEFENKRIMFGFRDATSAAMFEYGELEFEPNIVYMMDGEFSMEYYPGDLARLMEELGYADDDDDDEEDSREDNGAE